MAPYKYCDKSEKTDPPPSGAKILLASARHLKKRRLTVGQRRPWGQGGVSVANGPGYMGLAANMWVPMGAQVPILSPNDHPDPSQGQQEGFAKTKIPKNFQVPSNNLNTAISGLSGGPWPGLHGPSGHCVGPHGCSKPYCHQMTTQTNPGGIEGFWKKPNFQKFRCITSANTSNLGFRGQFWGAMATWA